MMLFTYGSRIISHMTFMAQICNVVIHFGAVLNNNYSIKKIWSIKYEVLNVYYMKTTRKFLELIKLQSSLHNDNTSAAILWWRSASRATINSHSQLKWAWNHILASQKGFFLNTERSLQIRHLEIQDVYIWGPEPRANAHFLVHVELHLFVCHR